VVEDGDGESDGEVGTMEVMVNDGNGEQNVDKRLVCITYDVVQEKLKDTASLDRSVRTGRKSIQFNHHANMQNSTLREGGI